MRIGLDVQCVRGYVISLCSGVGLEGGGVAHSLPFVPVSAIGTART